MSEYKYYVKKIDLYSADTVVIELCDKNDRPVFAYRPGQYAMISYYRPGISQEKHAFSIISSPTQRKFISFAIKIQGSFTQGISQLQKGAEVIVSGPYGEFCYNEFKHSNVVMIAGGIGITPFISTLNYAVGRGLSTNFSLIYSVRNLRAANFYSELAVLEKNNSNISILLSVTEESPKESTVAGFKNIIYKRVNADIISNFIGSIYDKTFFICGPQSFMSAMSNNLEGLGVKKTQIKSEEFSMIPDNTFWFYFRNFSSALGFTVILFILVFNLINKNSTVSTMVKKYDLAVVNKINQAAYDHLFGIYNAKNIALAELNRQILTANKKSNINIVTQQKKATAVKNMPVAPSPVITPITPPTPTTRVS